MSRVAKTLSGLVAVMVLAGCVSQQDHDALKARFDALQSDLISHAAAIEAWQTVTKGVICDIVAKNPQSYASQTTDYCGLGTGVGTPPAPPEFGED